ncbi:MAG: hypothetical protein JSU90_09125 [Nitrospiraceae bacterium]|nr:MAG: hypothetical protein JSU90_09125 [Nitrospiraceae bacterium]
MIRLPEETAGSAMYKRKAMKESGRVDSPRGERNWMRCLCLVPLVIFLAVPLVLTLSGLADGQIKLKTRVPELCYECHTELKKAQTDTYRHFLFKQGKCSSCHNPHVSKNKALMVEGVDALCTGCHDAIGDALGKGIVHGALRDHECTECHLPHSGEQGYLLVKEEKGLCLSCHENLTDQLEKPFICGPFKKGDCSACHDPHASPDDSLLVSEPNRLCSECHGPKCKAGPVSIVSAVKGSDCTSCHSGHSSHDQGLLGPFGHPEFLGKKCGECHNPITATGQITTKLKGADLCFNCQHQRNKSRYEYVDNDLHVKGKENPCTVCHDYHASNQKNLTKKESRLCVNCHEETERRTQAMERALASRICDPIRERKCFECHIPSHSSRPLNYRAEEISLCARCHSAQHRISHPLGTDVTDPRDGSPVTCNSCHSMHSSGSDFMLTHDRKRALCIQCHKM